MSSTPTSTFPLATSLSESGPEPGVRIAVRRAMYSGAWTALGVKSSATVAGSGAGEGPSAMSSPHPTASTASSDDQASHPAHDRSLSRRAHG